MKNRVLFLIAKREDFIALGYLGDSSLSNVFYSLGVLGLVLLKKVCVRSSSERFLESVLANTLRAVGEACGKIWIGDKFPRDGSFYNLFNLWWCFCFVTRFFLIFYIINAGKFLNISSFESRYMLVLSSHAKMSFSNGWLRNTPSSPKDPVGPMRSISWSTKSPFLCLMIHSPVNTI